MSKPTTTRKGQRADKISTIKSPTSILDVGDMGIGKLSLGRSRRKRDKKRLQLALDKLREDLVKLGLDVEYISLLESSEKDSSLQ